jgi:hypothetical protein
MIRHQTQHNMQAQDQNVMNVTHHVPTISRSAFEFAQEDMHGICVAVCGVS